MQCLLRTNFLTFEQIRQGFFQTEHAHHPHDPAAPRQEAEGDFRQADLNTVAVQGNAMMASQADLPTAAQRGTINGGHHRFAQGFKRAQLRLQVQDHLVEPLRTGLVDLDQFVEVATGEKGFLRRGDDHPGNRVFLGVQSGDDAGHCIAVHRVHGVGGLAGHIDGQDDNLILALLIMDGVSHGGGHREILVKSGDRLNNVR